MHDLKSQINARITVLQSISEQLRSDKPLSQGELERLKKLARPPEDALEVAAREEMSWKEAFLGKKDLRKVSP